MFDFFFFWQIQPFGCHGVQSNADVWTKMIHFVENCSRNISVNVCQIICTEIAINANHYGNVSEFVR